MFVVFSRTSAQVDELGPFAIGDENSTTRNDAPFFVQLRRAHGDRMRRLHERKNKKRGPQRDIGPTLIGSRCYESHSLLHFSTSCSLLLLAVSFCHSNNVHL